MPRLPFRIKAGLVHLGCSAFVACIAVAIIYLLWHPGAIASLQGVSRLVMVLIAVDVVLGPLMTLILFNPNKTRRLLLFDLATVASVQVAALIYGLVTIFAARPVYVVFNVDRFTVITAAEIVQESLQRASTPEFKRLPLGRPRIVAARLPDDPVARSDFLFATLDGGTDIYQYPEYFVNYSFETKRAISHSRALDDLRLRNGLNMADWRAFLETLGAPPEDLAYLPVEANSREGVAIINRKSGNVLTLATLYPAWG